jgi:hypothetical protein
MLKWETLQAILLLLIGEFEKINCTVQKSRIEVGKIV